jgi:ABC-type nitrate/sulfonate/bicarbonate transport system substrate-binding protein
MKANKWTLAAGHVHLFHLVAPIIARERNYFRDEGVGACEFLYSGSDAKTLEEMSEGRIQIGLDPKPYLVCEAKNRGADIFIVGGWLNTPAYGFIAAKDKSIKGLKDLAGKKVSAREPDGIDVRFARQLFRREGYDADQMVTWVVNGARSRRVQQPALDAGAVDAAMVILKDVPGMVADGYPLLADLSEVYPKGYAVRVTAARGDIVREQPERLSGLMRALIRAYRFMNQRYNDTKQILTRAGYQLDKDMDAALWEGKYHMFERIPQDGSINKAGLSQVIEEEKVAGKLPLSFSLEDIVVDRFVRAAADAANRRYGDGCE